MTEHDRQDTPPTDLGTEGTEGVEGTGSSGISAGGEWTASGVGTAIASENGAGPGALPMVLSPELDEARRPPLAQEDLDVFLDMSSELFAVLDPGKGVRWGNGTAAKLLGYTEEELRGIPFVDLIHPDDLGQARRAFAHDPGPAHAVRTRYRCKDGSWRWLEWTALTDTDTGLVYGAARDVTARQVAQGALAANEARLQAILDHSSAAIFVKDRVGRYTVVNDTFLRAFGFDGERSPR